MKKGKGENGKGNSGKKGEQNERKVMGDRELKGYYYINSSQAVPQNGLSPSYMRC